MWIGTGNVHGPSVPTGCDSDPDDGPAGTIGGHTAPSGGMTMEVHVDAPTRIIGRLHRTEPDGTRVFLRQCPLCECL